MTQTPIETAEIEDADALLEAGDLITRRPVRASAPSRREGEHEGATMTLMRIRDLTACSQHRRVLVNLEDVAATRRLTFHADPDDARRLARELARGPRACHPIFDFIQALLRSWHAAPTRVVLEDVNGDGIGALVYLRQGEVESHIECYPPDALTIALRTGVPIYATPEVLGHAQASAPTPLGDADTGEWLQRVRPEDFER
jgi:bifunctional DNase/RNase